MSVSSRLTQVFKTAEEIPFNDESKIIIFSDCHRGDNGWSDDFADNQHLFFHALNYYYDQGFTYIEVGDGEELWENSNFADIRKAYDNIYWRMSLFYQDDRLYLIWGNHNNKWKNEKNVRKNLDNYFDERSNYEQWNPDERRPLKDSRHVERKSEKPLFSNIKVHEGLKLHHEDRGLLIFLAHGHQGNLLCDRLWWLGKYVVRHIWRPLQGAGFHDPTSPAKNFKKRAKVEELITEWVDDNKQMVIVGHTHRSVFPKLEKPPYYNCGSCVHPRCITGIEIEGGEIRLIKWLLNVDYKIDRPQAAADQQEKPVPMETALYITREIIEDCCRKLDELTISQE